MGIGDALLARFKQAVALHVAALPSGTPAALAQVLDALALLSPHAEAVPLLESLLAWRLAALRYGGCLLLVSPSFTPRPAETRLLALRTPVASAWLKWTPHSGRLSVAWSLRTRGLLHRPLT
jgi:hypothetical protein